MKNKSFLKKAANSFAGRALRRLVGEEKGAVMMEYVVVGLLIAVAAVVIIGIFGGSISAMFGSMSHAVEGNPGAAQKTITDQRSNTQTQIDSKAADHAAIVRKEGGTESAARNAWE